MPMFLVKTLSLLIVLLTALLYACFPERASTGSAVFRNVISVLALLQLQLQHVKAQDSGHV